MIQIFNLRNIMPIKKYDVIVDRTSILGNPFYSRDESQRNLICDKYHIWFHKALNTDAIQRKRFKQELCRLIKLYQTHDELNLFCWCTPKRCHAETIKQYIESEIWNE
jgi:hypothetical protein